MAEEEPEALEQRDLHRHVAEAEAGEEHRVPARPRRPPGQEPQGKLHAKERGCSDDYQQGDDAPLHRGHARAHDRIGREESPQLPPRRVAEEEGAVVVHRGDGKRVGPHEGRLLLRVVQAQEIW